MNNMGQKYNTDTLLAASRLGIVRGLAIVSDRHAAEGGTGRGGREGTPVRFQLNTAISVSGYHSRACQPPSQNPDLTAHYILPFYLLHIHTQHDETRYAGKGENQLPDTNRSQREQPKKNQRKSKLQVPFLS